MSDDDIMWIKEALKEIKADIKDIYKNMNERELATAADIAALKTKAGVWGTFGAILGGGLTALTTWLMGRS